MAIIALRNSSSWNRHLRLKRHPRRENLRQHFGKSHVLRERRRRKRARWRDSKVEEGYISTDFDSFAIIRYPWPRTTILVESGHRNLRIAACPSFLSCLNMPKQMQLEEFPLSLYIGTRPATFFSEPVAVIAA